MGRDIQKALARTRPSAIEPGYDRPPAPMPEAPGLISQPWLARVGTPVGVSTEYPHDSGTLKGVWLDEVNPINLDSSYEGFYPSRTRDASNNYIETIGWNANSYDCGAGYQWPIPLGGGLGVYVWVYESTLAHFPAWKFWYPYTSTLMEVLSVSTGWPVTGRWNNSGLTEVIYIHRLAVYPWNTGWHAYPYASVGDVIPVGFGKTTQGYEYVVNVYDMTPRIPIPCAGGVPGSQFSYVKIDTANQGTLWTTDIDT